MKQLSSSVRHSCSWRRVARVVSPDLDAGNNAHRVSLANPQSAPHLPMGICCHSLAGAGINTPNPCVRYSIGSAIIAQARHVSAQRSRPEMGYRRSSAGCATTKEKIVAQSSVGRGAGGEGGEAAEGGRCQEVRRDMRVGLLRALLGGVGGSWWMGRESGETSGVGWW